MSNIPNNGSEIHRLQTFKDYDPDLFERLYKKCRPLIKNLSFNVDSRRYNLTPDIIQSYFWDKFMLVFNKYQDVYDEERLKATLLRSLITFKNKLLRSAYTQQSEFHQSISSLDVLLDKDKELLDDFEESLNKESLSERLHNFLRDTLTPDEYLLFLTQLDPPPYLLEKRQESQGKISILHLIDFFDLPKNKRSYKMIVQMRHNIQATLEKAQAYFNA